MLTTNNYNPDVLTCIANVSSDEVFTPPQLASQLLDLLPAELWSNKKATFLDPGCKSGVFLREIARRLDKGLERKIPDRQKRRCGIVTLADGPALSIKNKTDSRQIEAVSLKAAESLRISTTPTTLVLDSAQRTRWWYIGALPWNVEYEAIQRLKIPLLFSLLRQREIAEDYPGQDPVTRLGTSQSSFATGHFVFGSAESKVRMVEFGDFQCPFCSSAFSVLKEIDTTYSGRVSLVFKQFPLPSHSLSLFAAKATVAAANQGKFREMYTLIYRLFPNVESNSILQSAAKVSVDASLLERDINSVSVAAEVQRDMEEGSHAGVSGTPTLFINGRRYEGPVSISPLKVILDDLLRR